MTQNIVLNRVPIDIQKIIKATETILNLLTLMFDK